MTQDKCKVLIDDNGDVEASYTHTEEVDTINAGRLSPQVREDLMMFGLRQRLRDAWIGAYLTNGRDPVKARQVLEEKIKQLLA